MANTYQSVTFNEGEPLDAGKLNSLGNSFTELYKSSLSNATLNDQGELSVPLVHIGQISLVLATADKVATPVEVTAPTSFSKTEPIFIIAGVAQPIQKSIISVYAYKSGEKYLISGISNVSASTVLVSYVMIQQKTQN